MNDPGTTWLIGAVLRCYPSRWRRRHGHEATDLAALLIRDGTPPASIACSYLAGAAREWLTPQPGRRLSTLAYVLLVAACLLSVSAALLAARTAPARAASTNQTPPAAHCRAGSAERAVRMTPATGRPQTPIREAGHARSC